MELGKWISKNDTLKMLEITNGCLFCNSEIGYRKLIERFNELIFFDYAISALIDMQDISCENMNSGSVNCGYPAGFLEEYTNRKYQLIDPIYGQFLRTFDVQCTAELKNYYTKISENSSLKLAKDFGLFNTYLYGICGNSLNPFTVFTLTGEQIKNEQRTKAIIQYLVPYLSIALQNAISCRIKADTKGLSQGELEVLKWLKEGKSSWEISAILNRSERVINFHTGNIIRKLNANNRTHAVAIALESHIMDNQ